MFPGHDFGPGVSVLTTELLHHVCLAVYAVNILLHFFFFFFWRTPRLFGCFCYSSSRNPVNAQIVQHVIGFVSLGFPDHLPAPLPWPPLPPSPPSPPLAWSSLPPLSLPCCRLPQLSGQHHLSSLQTLLVTNIILHFKHHSHHCLKC